MKITEAQDKKIPHVSRFWNQSIKLKNFPPLSDFKESLNIHQASMDRHAPLQGELKHSSSIDGSSCTASPIITNP
jgi:hypothetical protein